MASSSQRPAKSTRRAQFVLADSIIDNSDSDSNFSDVNLMDFDISDGSSDDDASVVGPRDDGGDAISNDGVWTVIRNLTNDKCPNVNDFTSPIGPVFVPPEATAVDYFERFFAPTEQGGVSLWEHLVIETNKYKEYYTRNKQVLKQHSKVHKWKDVTEEQMKAFIGTILNMGINRKKTIESYWDSTNWSQIVPPFKETFTQDTFKLILRFFHVSDSDQEPEKGTPEYDQLYKFRPVLEHLNKAWQKEFNLGHVLSIDESIVGFKGRHPLVNYIRIKKHHQWGPKEYNLCDSATGYCSQTMYHTKGMTKGVSGQPFSVCEALMEPHINKNHHLIVDNYYTSVDLCEKFLTKGTYVTGTVRAGRVKLPNEMKVKMKNKGEILASRKGNLLAVSWVDRKQVRLLSTCSTANMVEKEVFNGTRKVPQVVVDYNSGMGGVDQSDQMTDQYSGEFRTVKLWKKVVLHLIDRTATNAYTCYKANPNIVGKKMDHHRFLIQLVEGLIGDYREPRKHVGRPSCSPVARKTARHFLEVIPDGKRKKCTVCAKPRGQGYKGSRIGTWCKDCGVGLCKGACFNSYHT
ncbi:piggyBac transposable element-derived protein 4-like [Watersipora subatra]|uniref:piggyBac transposable element-derived protein 4-like n=1 Tax=Watersipora subatra TaxID=2589382 RepID=UPI00355B0D90